MFPTDAQEYSPRCPAGQWDGGCVAGIPSSPVCAKQWQTSGLDPRGVVRKEGKAGRRGEVTSP